MYSQEYIDQLIYLIGLKELNLQTRDADLRKINPLAQQFLNEQKKKKEKEDMERMKQFFTVEKKVENGTQNT